MTVLNDWNQDQRISTNTTQLVPGLSPQYLPAYRRNSTSQLCRYCMPLAPSQTTRVREPVPACHGPTDWKLRLYGVGEYREQHIVVQLY
eukprot:2349502-Rhodomonas_salina.1